MTGNRIHSFFIRTILKIRTVHEAENAQNLRTCYLLKNIPVDAFHFLELLLGFFLYQNFIPPNVKFVFSL